MISTKSTTKTWSTAEQTSSLRGDGKNTLSAKDRDQVLGGEDLGTHLNKIADPNWVDPAKMRKVGNNELDKDAFLKLFLAQMKNQDPTNPMQGHELAAQLAQFTSLEKLNNIDTGIGQLAKQNDPAKGYDALNLIGKGIGGDSSKILRNDTTARHEITFNLGGAAQEVELSVRNASGQEVKSLVARNLKAGANRVAWDGIIEAGSIAPEGEYNVMITAKNSSGQKIAAETKFQGRVTGVKFTAEGPVLMVGDQSIKMSDVKSIFEPDTAGANKAPLVEAEARAGKDAKNLVSPSAGMGGNLENVGMSQDFINRLQKEGSAAASAAVGEAVEEKAVKPPPTKARM